MIDRAKNITRYQQQNMERVLRGVFAKGDYDLLEAYLLRYPSAIVTLETALSLYGIIDEWANPPFRFSFQIGYRPIKDSNVDQIWDKEPYRSLGVTKMKHGKTSFQIYDKERLLLEVLRREKLLPQSIYKETIAFFRKEAEKGQLKPPLLRKYVKRLPKGALLQEKLQREIL
jgi:hypothetical protein